MKYMKFGKHVKATRSRRWKSLDTVTQRTSDHDVLLNSSVSPSLFFSTFLFLTSKLSRLRAVREETVTQMAPRTKQTERKSPPAGGKPATGGSSKHRSERAEKENRVKVPPRNIQRELFAALRKFKVPALKAKTSKTKTGSQTRTGSKSTDSERFREILSTWKRAANGKLELEAPEQVCYVLPNCYEDKEALAKKLKGSDAALVSYLKPIAIELGFGFCIANVFLQEEGETHNGHRMGKVDDSEDEDSDDPYFIDSDDPYCENEKPRGKARYPTFVGTTEDDMEVDCAFDLINKEPLKHVWCFIDEFEDGVFDDRGKPDDYEVDGCMGSGSRLVYYYLRTVLVLRPGGFEGPLIEEDEDSGDTSEQQISPPKAVKRQEVDKKRKSSGDNQQRKAKKARLNFSSDVIVLSSD
ncbi:hypothetical protein SCHPADRAFT_993232 [Schizopora paradoxa]|uniref:Uncharacterized protein n=1 Tax=Schizopora paradoxa TaxID=27342 RepID=A0A0H2S474_9AGAM|nr:hypothetical protein SCHPADRAFT_993232 [Schizopora paradoxa]